MAIDSAERRKRLSIAHKQSRRYQMYLNILQYHLKDYAPSFGSKIVYSMKKSVCGTVLFMMCSTTSLKWCNSLHKPDFWVDCVNFPMRQAYFRCLVFWIAWNTFMHKRKPDGHNETFRLAIEFIQRISCPHVVDNMHGPWLLIFLCVYEC